MRPCRTRERVRCSHGLELARATPELRTFFSNEIPDELGHAQLLADKIVALGGTPTVQAADVKSTDDSKEMLQNALDDEVATIARAIASIAEAASCYGRSNAPGSRTVPFHGRRYTTPFHTCANVLLIDSISDAVY